MRTIWLSLAWKEWHEHKWKLAALTAVLCGANAFVLYLINPDKRQDLFDAIYFMAIGCAIPLALFIGAARRPVNDLAAPSHICRLCPFLHVWLPPTNWRSAY